MLGSRLPERITIESTDIVLPTDKQATLKAVVAKTTRPLGANESYESEWVDVSTKSTLLYLVNTDTDGTLKIQHSIDDSIVDYEDTISITGGTPAKDAVTIGGDFVKIIYENGATAQTRFRLMVSAVP